MSESSMTLVTAEGLLETLRASVPRPQEHIKVKLTGHLPQRQIMHIWVIFSVFSVKNACWVSIWCDGALSRNTKTSKTHSLQTFKEKKHKVQFDWICTHTKNILFCISICALPFKSLELIRKIIIKDAFNWSKVTVNAFEAAQLFSILVY